MHGLNAKKHVKRTKSMIGYCPQHDEVPEQLTGREALYMFARLRGVPVLDIHYIVQDAIELTCLSPYEDQLIKNYSPGYKRRVSVAVAIIGVPKFILLDEPTAGLDTAARLILWKVFDEIRQAGKTLILATRSIEECEAVCTHIAVMVRGHVVSTGSPKHLKEKYDKGYMLSGYAQVNEMGEYNDLAPAENFLLDAFPSSKLFTKNVSYIDILLPDNIPLSMIFERMEEAKRTYKLRDYKVQPSSYQQMLMKFLNTD